jgi:hypothetical protein
MPTVAEERRRHRACAVTIDRTARCARRTVPKVKRPVRRAHRAVRSMVTAHARCRRRSSATVDASYRYLNAGKARSGFDAFAQNTRIKDITANEFRVGMVTAHARCRRRSSATVGMKAQ